MAENKGCHSICTVFQKQNKKDLSE